MKSSGNALITALFIMAIVAIAATAMSWQSRLGIRRTELTLNADKAYLVSEGIKFQAISVLTNNIAQQKPDKVLDPLPQQFPEHEFAGATVSGELHDAQGKFNINNLISPTFAMPFVRLLRAVDSNITEQQAQTLVEAISEWISFKPSNQLSPNDEVYLKAQPPYRAAHFFMTNVSELRLVNGITPELYLKLKPHLTALPETTPININTASAPVLMSLFEGLTPEQAQQFIAKRESQGGFTQLDQVLDEPLLQKFNFPKELIALNSDYFLSQSQVTIGKQQLLVYTLLRRYVERDKVALEIIWETRGEI